MTVLSNIFKNAEVIITDYFSEIEDTDIIGNCIFFVIEPEFIPQIEAEYNVIFYGGTEHAISVQYDGVRIYASLHIDVFSDNEEEVKLELDTDDEQVAITRLKAIASEDLVTVEELMLQYNI